MAKGSITTLRELLDAGYWWHAHVAEEINNHQLGWWFVENYPLVAQNKSIQARSDEKGLAPAAEIADYAALMKLGDRFPAIIVTHDGWLVDGITRTEAARKNKQETFPAFVLNANFSEQDPDSPIYEQVTTLGGAQNLKHGRRMSKAAIISLIDRISTGRTPMQIQRDLHLGSYNMANTVWNARRAKDKAKTLGIDVGDMLSPSHLKLFGGKIEKFTDPVWGKAIGLTLDAHLGYNDTRDLVSQIEGLRSEPERLKFIETERDHNATVIRGGTRAAPGKERRVKQFITYLNKDDNLPIEMLEWNPAKGPDYLQGLYSARKKFNLIIERQEKIENARHVNSVTPEG